MRALRVRRRAIAFTHRVRGPLRLRSRSLSAAQRGRGWGPLRSNGRVRWCFSRAGCFRSQTPQPTSPSPRKRGSPPSPPAMTRAERASDAMCESNKVSHCSCRLTELSNVVAYVCRHSHGDVGNHVHFPTHQRRRFRSRRGKACSSGIGSVSALCGGTKEFPVRPPGSVICPI
jgi:hypothetical protein